jgi:hypothetical protein
MTDNPVKKLAEISETRSSFRTHKSLPLVPVSSAAMLYELSYTQHHEAVWLHVF